MGQDTAKLILGVILMMSALLVVFYQAGWVDVHCCAGCYIATGRQAEGIASSLPGLFIFKCCNTGVDSLRCKLIVNFAGVYDN